MRIFGFLDQKRSKTIQILSQNFDCYGVIKALAFRDAVVAAIAAAIEAAAGCCWYCAAVVEALLDGANAPPKAGVP